VLIVINEKLAQYMAGTIATVSTTYSPLTNRDKPKCEMRSLSCSPVSPINGPTNTFSYLFLNR
jgi:hypothetical protein